MRCPRASTTTSKDPAFTPWKVTHRRATVGSSQAPFSAPQSGNPESRSPLKGSRRFFLTLPSGSTPGGGVGTAFPLDPPLDRQGGTGPGAGARCRRPSEVKGGGRRDGSAESRPHRCPRGTLGANGLDRRAPHCLGCEARGDKVSTGRAAPHARRLHTLKSHDAGTSQATTKLFPGVFQHPREARPRGERQA